jgi:hypothetical protein
LGGNPCLVFDRLSDDWMLNCRVFQQFCAGRETLGISAIPSSADEAGVL